MCGHTIQSSLLFWVHNYGGLFIAFQCSRFNLPIFNCSILFLASYIPWIDRGSCFFLFLVHSWFGLRASPLIPSVSHKTWRLWMVNGHSVCSTNSPNKSYLCRTQLSWIKTVRHSLEYSFKVSCTTRKNCLQKSMQTMIDLIHRTN